MECGVLNVRQLECFRAIMTTGSMTQAAESLGIAQPSASSLIASLEHTLGFALFDRAKGRLVATPEAKALMPDVVRALESVEFTEHRANQIKENRQGDLSIVSYPDIAIDFLPSLLSEFLESRSGVRVNLQARRTEMMTGLLATHDYDLAITTRLVEPRNLHVREYRLPCVLAFRKGDAPRSLEPITAPDLFEKKLITVTSLHPTVVQFAERFSQAGLEHPSVTIEVQTFESVCGFVRRSPFVGLVDAITASRYEAEVDLRNFSPTIWHTVYLLRPIDRPSSRLLQQFESMVSEQLERLRTFQV